MLPHMLVPIILGGSKVTVSRNFRDSIVTQLSSLPVNFSRTESNGIVTATGNSAVPAAGVSFTSFPTGDIYHSWGFPVFSAPFTTNTLFNTLQTGLNDPLVVISQEYTAGTIPARTAVQFRREGPSSTFNPSAGIQAVHLLSFAIPGFRLVTVGGTGSNYKSDGRLVTNVTIDSFLNRNTPSCVFLFRINTEGTIAPSLADSETDPIWNKIRTAPDGFQENYELFYAYSREGGFNFDSSRNLPSSPTDQSTGVRGFVLSFTESTET